MRNIPVQSHAPQINGKSPQFGPPSAPSEGTWLNDLDAAHLGLTSGTLRVWRSRRQVPFVRVNRLVRFRKRDLDQFLEANSVPVAGKGVRP